MDMFLSKCEAYGLPYKVVPGGFEEKTNMVREMMADLKPSFPERERETGKQFIF
jgi:hypothetical protein